MYEVLIDSTKCNGCGECVDVCPNEVFELYGNKSVALNAEDCIGCQNCVIVCKKEAIIVREFGSVAA